MGVQNTNLNTFMTLTTAEEGNRFYFGIPDWLITSEKQTQNHRKSLVSRSRELHAVYKETLLPLRRDHVSSMGVNLITQNIVICAEKHG